MVTGEVSGIQQLPWVCRGLRYGKSEEEGSEKREKDRHDGRR